MCCTGCAIARATTARIARTPCTHTHTHTPTTHTLTPTHMNDTSPSILAAGTATDPPPAHASASDTSFRCSARTLCFLSRALSWAKELRGKTLGKIGLKTQAFGARVVEKVAVAAEEEYCGFGFDQHVIELGLDVAAGAGGEGGGGCWECVGHVA